MAPRDASAEAINASTGLGGPGRIAVASRLPLGELTENGQGHLVDIVGVCDIVPSWHAICFVVLVFRLCAAR